MRVWSVQQKILMSKQLIPSGNVPDQYNSQKVLIPELEWDGLSVAVTDLHTFLDLLRTALFPKITLHVSETWGNSGEKAYFASVT